MTDDLYSLPLEEFTKARNAREKQLRKEGDRDAAAEVKALRKPSAPAWALNQVARANPKGVAALAKAGEEVRRGQEGLVAGGERAKLTKAVAKQRELVAQLVGEATEAAEVAGISTTASFEDKVSNTLRAAAVDEDVAAELAEGRLTREHEAVGLFGFGGDAAVADRPEKAAVKGEGRGAAKPRGSKKAAPGGRKSTQADRKRTQADRKRETERRKLTKQLDAAREAKARAGRTLEAAERSRDEERDRAERAAARLKEAEAAARDAAKRLRAADAEVTRLDRRLKD